MAELQEAVVGQAVAAEELEEVQESLVEDHRAHQEEVAVEEEAGYQHCLYRRLCLPHFL